MCKPGAETRLTTTRQPSRPAAAAAAHRRDHWSEQRQEEEEEEEEEEEGLSTVQGGKLTPPELIAVVNATLQHYRYISIGQVRRLPPLGCRGMNNNVYPRACLRSAR
eukprot:COSAG01_NODE_220_length_21453_cov_118.998361_21_plen_107_part_00